MPPEGDGQVLPTLVMVGQLGFVMVACILAGFFGGTFLDRQLHSSPVLTIALLVVGIGGGMIAVYRLVMKTVEKEPRDGHEGRP